MEDRFTFLITGRGKAQVIKPADENGFFHWLYVNPRYRRHGYGLEIMKFAIQYVREFLEMDILTDAKVCQRNAARLGYRDTGPSPRYLRCRLWLYQGSKIACEPSRLTVAKRIRYRRVDGITDVLYLDRTLASPNIVWSHISDDPAKVESTSQRIVCA
jgi:hypothetical protein